jgi:hypothetical protein
VVWSLEFAEASGGEIACRCSAGRGDGLVLGRACSVFLAVFLVTDSK